MALVAAAFRRIGAPMPKVPFDVVNFGVRCGPAGKFDDALGQVWVSASGEVDVALHRGTTDPGVSGLYSPVHPGGTAAVSRGWHPRVWRRGTYAGARGTGTPRPALLQDGTMRVDRQPRPGVPGLARVPIVAGVPGYGSGVHLHYMGSGDDDRSVGGWSLGCQGYEDEIHHIAAMARCDACLAAHPTWTRFGYALLLLEDLVPGRPSPEA